MTLVFATHNPNKVREIQSLMPKNIKVKSLTEIGCHEEITEDAPSLEGNALLKACYIKENYGLSCFADDTGLEVDALDEAPGVFSARYAGNQKNSEDNINKLLQELSEKQDRSAKFKTVIALIYQEKEFTFEGICKGKITPSRRGSKGFGYDPVFQPDGYDQTFAEMSLELKNQIGHRGKAVKKLINFLNYLEKNDV